MKKLFIFCLLIAVCIQGKGQDFNKIDSLISLLEKVNNSVKISVYNKLAWEYRKSYPDSTIFYSRKSMKLSKIVYGENANIAKPYNFLGMAYVYKGDDVKAYDYYNLASEEALAHKDSSQYAHSLNSLGRLFMNQGNFVKSYDYYFVAKDIFEKIGDEVGLGYCFKSLSELYQTQNNFTKALQMSEQAFNIRKKTGNVPGQISILTDIARIYNQTKQYKKAHDYYIQANVKAESIHDAINIAIINNGIANLYFKEAKYSEALNYAQKAMKTAGSSKNINLNNRIKILFGKIYFAEGRLQQANEYFAEVLRKTKKSHDLPIRKEAYFYLSKICKIEGRFTCAYENFKMYSYISSALNDAEAARDIERLESRLDIEARNRENEILKANRARDKALIDRQRIYNIALTIVILAILMVVFNLWLTSRKRRKTNLWLTLKNDEIATQKEEIARQNEKINKQNKKLVKQNKDLVKLNSEKDTLMNIVAHDLKAPFTRIIGLIDLMSFTSLNKEQGNFVKLQRDVSQAGLDIISDLLEINAFEEDKGKMEIVRVDVNSILLNKQQAFSSETKSKDLKLKVEAESPDLFFKTDMVYLSRILDNLISNAIKFSCTGKDIILKSWEEEGSIFIAVKDFGQGFSEDDKKNLYKKFTKLSAQPTGGESSNGLGLAIVKGLLDKLGAEVSLISETGDGSEFIIKFPTDEVMTEGRVLS